MNAGRPRRGATSSSPCTPTLAGRRASTIPSSTGPTTTRTTSTPWPSRSRRRSGSSWGRPRPDARPPERTAPGANTTASSVGPVRWGRPTTCSSSTAFTRTRRRRSGSRRTPTWTSWPSPKPTSWRSSSGWRAPLPPRRRQSWARPRPRPSRWRYFAGARTPPRSSRAALLNSSRRCSSRRARPRASGATWPSRRASTKRAISNTAAS